MSRAGAVERLFDTYGDALQWRGQTWKALLQALEPSAGEGRRYRCLAPAAFQPDAGDVLLCRGGRYTVLRTDGSFAAGERLYTWCIVEREDKWGR